MKLFGHFSLALDFCQIVESALVKKLKRVKMIFYCFLFSLGEKFSLKTESKIEF